MARHWLLRTFALFAAVLQLTLGAAVPILDARVEGQAVRTTVAHVEAERSPECPPVHAADCALCQYLTGFGEGARPAASLPSERAASAPRLQDTRPAGDIAFAAARPRAPPHAS